MVQTESQFRINAGSVLFLQTTDMMQLYIFLGCRFAWLIQFLCSDKTVLMLLSQFREDRVLVWNACFGHQNHGWNLPRGLSQDLQCCHVVITQTNTSKWRRRLSWPNSKSEKTMIFFFFSKVKGQTISITYIGFKPENTLMAIMAPKHMYFIYITFLKSLFLTGFVFACSWIECFTYWSQNLFGNTLLYSIT